MGHKVTDISAAELIEELADAYESDTLNWTMGTMINHRGAVCLVGGLRMLTAEKSSPTRSYKRSRVACELIAQYLGLPTKLVSDSESIVVAWNDGFYSNPYHRPSCKQDVINVLKETAKDIRNKTVVA